MFRREFSPDERVSMAHEYWRLSRTSWTAQGLTIGVALFASVAPWGRDWAAITLINVLFVIAFSLFSGYTGILTFGHFAFALVGAYTGVLLTLPVASKQLLLMSAPGWLRTLSVDVFLAHVLIVLIVSIVSMSIGVVVLRLNGLAASLATLAVLVVVVEVVAITPAISGEAGGTLTGYPTAHVDLLIRIFVPTLLLIAIVGSNTFLFERTVAARDDEVSARSLGVAVKRDRLILFVMSAALFGVGGFLYAQHSGALASESLSLDYTFLVIAMAVIGGMRSVSAAALGAIFVTTLSEVLAQVEYGTSILGMTIRLPSGTNQYVIALVLLLVLVFRPSGLFFVEDRRR